MTVRVKIALLITAAGFLASLIFSCIIMWEMTEQPFRIIDSDLQIVAQRAVNAVARNAKTIRGKENSNNPLFISGEHYWLKIYDHDNGKMISESHLAKLIKIPEPEPGASATVSVIIPRKKIYLGQDRTNEVTFRVKSFKIALGGHKFRVCAARPMEKLEEEMWDIVIGVVSGLMFSVILLLAISYFVAGLILKPVRIINEQSRDISEKHLDKRIPVIGDKDEFNALAQTLNRVFDRLQHAFLRQKQLLADASHELKTPLTMMRLSVDEIRSIQNENPSCPQVECLARLTEQVLRMERLVKNLLDLSSLEIEVTTTKDSINLTHILENLITDYRFLADTRNIKINKRLSRNLLVKGNEEKLNRAFSNILDNAVKYNEDGGWVEVVGNTSGLDQTITITNSGPDIAESEIPRIFEQFYRIEKSRSQQHGGSGLGLAIVKKIVELHDGEVELESRQGSWTRVTIILPRHISL